MAAVSLRNFEPLEDELVTLGKRARVKHVRGTNFPFSGREFPVGVQRYAYYQGYLPDYVSTLTLDLVWVQLGGLSSQTVTWQSAVASITPGDTTRVVDKAFAANDTVSPSSLSAGLLAKSTITVTNTDSLAAGDWLVVRISRDPSATACGGTCLLLGCSINYTGT